MSNIKLRSVFIAFAGFVLATSCIGSEFGQRASKVQNSGAPISGTGQGGPANASVDRQSAASDDPMHGIVGSIWMEHYTSDQADTFPHLIGNWYSSGGTYRYMGGINSALVDDMISSGPPPSGVLIINSPGGENAAAIRLGLWLRQNRIAVRVPFSCISACAQFVFVGAVSRSLDTGAWVACHQNPISNATVLRTRRALSPVEAEELEDALALYEAAGVDEEFALACGAAAEPVCLIPREAGLVDPDGLPVEALRSRSFWIPARSQLSEYGISIEGAGLESASSLHDWDGDFANGRYLFGTLARSDPSVLSQVPTCGA